MTRTLQESGTVVERIHPDVSAPSARQGSFLGAAGRLRGAVRPSRDDAIESPRARSTRRAAPGSFQTMHVAHPQRFWATFYVDNRSIESYGQRRLGHDTRTLHESWTVVESDTPGCKCAFGATMDPILARLEAVCHSTEATIESRSHRSGKTLS